MYSFFLFIRTVVATLILCSQTEIWKYLYLCGFGQVVYCKQALIWIVQSTDFIKIRGLKWKMNSVSQSAIQIERDFEIFRFYLYAVYFHFGGLIAVCVYAREFSTFFCRAWKDPHHLVFGRLKLVLFWYINGKEVVHLTPANALKSFFKKNRRGKM